MPVPGKGLSGALAPGPRAWGPCGPLTSGHRTMAQLNENTTPTIPRLAFGLVFGPCPWTLPLDLAFGPALRAFPSDQGVSFLNQGPGALQALAAPNKGRRMPTPGRFITGNYRKISIKSRGIPGKSAWRPRKCMAGKKNRRAQKKPPGYRGPGFGKVTEAGVP